MSIDTDAPDADAERVTIDAIKGATGWGFDRVDARDRLRFRSGTEIGIVLTRRQAEKIVAAGARVAPSCQEGLPMSDVNPPLFDDDLRQNMRRVEMELFQTLDARVLRDLAIRSAPVHKTRIERAAILLERRAKLLDALLRL